MLANQTPQSDHGLDSACTHQHQVVGGEVYGWTTGWRRWVWWVMYLFVKVREITGTGMHEHLKSCNQNLVDFGEF